MDREEFLRWRISHYIKVIQKDEALHDYEKNWLLKELNSNNCLEYKYGVINGVLILGGRIKNE